MPTITAKHSRIYITYISRYLSVAFHKLSYCKQHPTNNTKHIVSLICYVLFCLLAPLYRICHKHTHTHTHTLKRCERAWVENV